MDVRVGITQRAEQRLALLPQMLQAIEVLQLSAIDLVACIEQELASNEALQREADGSAGSAEAPEAGRDGAADVLETAGDAVPELRDDPESRTPSRERDTRQPTQASADARHDLFASVPEPEAGLRDHIRAQLDWMELGSGLRAALDGLVSAVDERGLLPLDDATFAELVGAELVAEAEAALRSLQPCGLGARSPTEAMLWQVAPDDPDRPLIERLLTDQLEPLARGHRRVVCAALDIEPDELDGLVQRIRELDPRPGSAFGSQGTAAVVKPDLLVVRDPAAPERWRVVVDDVDLPVLTVDPTVAALADDAGLPRELRAHVRERVRAAHDFLGALRQRRETLARVGAAVLRHQPEFLERGRSALRPLRMAVVADELDLHVSTISRAIAGKYVQTERGVTALRDFFDGDRRSGVGGDKGRIAIRSEIERLIADENPERPLSDDEIVRALEAWGARVARRTVAKHRTELGIPSSLQRKKGRAP